MPPTADNDKANYLPTPEQIAAECRMIQQSWSAYEHTIRAGLKGRNHDNLLHHARDPRPDLRER